MWPKTPKLNKNDPQIAKTSLVGVVVVCAIADQLATGHLEVLAAVAVEAVPVASSPSSEVGGVVVGVGRPSVQRLV